MGGAQLKGEENSAFELLSYFWCLCSERRWRSESKGRDLSPPVQSLFCILFHRCEAGRLVPETPAWLWDIWMEVRAPVCRCMLILAFKRDSQKTHFQPHVCSLA